jgi:hypothetical protein
MRSARRRPVVLLGLLAYLLAAAILPPGHMAASLASGSPFHLCPGDARSVLILTALSRADAATSTGLHAAGPSPHHLHGPAASDSMADPTDGPVPDVGSSHGDAAEAAEPRFGTNCAPASPGVAAVAATDHAVGDLEQGGRSKALPAEGPVTPGRWLRPAPRSPPV